MILVRDASVEFVGRGSPATLHHLAMNANGKAFPAFLHKDPAEGLSVAISLVIHVVKLVMPHNQLDRAAFALGKVMGLYAGKRNRCIRESLKPSHALTSTPNSHDSNSSFYLFRTLGLRLRIMRISEQPSLLYSRLK